MMRSASSALRRWISAPARRGGVFDDAADGVVTIDFHLYKLHDEETSGVVDCAESGLQFRRIELHLQLRQAGGDLVEQGMAQRLGRGRVGTERR